MKAFQLEDSELEGRMGIREGMGRNLDGSEDYSDQSVVNRLLKSADLFDHLY